MGFVSEISISEIKSIAGNENRRVTVRGPYVETLCAFFCIKIS